MECSFLSLSSRRFVTLVVPRYLLRATAPYRLVPLVPEGSSSAVASLPRPVPRAGPECSFPNIPGCLERLSEPRGHKFPSSKQSCLENSFSSFLSFSSPDTPNSLQPSSSQSNLVVRLAFLLNYQHNTSAVMAQSSDPAIQIAVMEVGSLANDTCRGQAADIANAAKQGDLGVIRQDELPLEAHGRAQGYRPRGNPIFGRHIEPGQAAAAGWGGTLRQC